MVNKNRRTRLFVCFVLATFVLLSPLGNYAQQNETNEMHPLDFKTVSYTDIDMSKINPVMLEFITISDNIMPREQLSDETRRSISSYLSNNKELIRDVMIAYKERDFSAFTDSDISITVSDFFFDAVPDRNGIQSFVSRNINIHHQMTLIAVVTNCVIFYHDGSGNVLELVGGGTFVKYPDSATYEGVSFSNQRAYIENNLAYHVTDVDYGISSFEWGVWGNGLTSGQW